MDNNNFDNEIKNTDTQGQFSQQAPQYQQTAAYTPVPNVAPYQPVGEEPVSLGDWIGTLLLFNLVPCVGLIVCIVWAFSKDTKKSKKNFCRAYLIIYAVSIVLVIALYAVLIGMFASAFSSGNFPKYY